MKRFHSFRLDTVNQCLWRGEHRVPITPKAFDVLRYLVEHPGRLVTQEEILEALWPGTYVNQEVIKKHILGIRKVLGDRHDEPVFIETLPRRGYQFVAQVTDEVSAAPSGVASAPENVMVGRETALSSLDRALDQSLSGQRQVVFVTGEAGIGKTTLVDAFHQRATRHTNLRIALGQCVEGFGGKEAYYPMLEALGQLSSGAPGNPIVQTLATQAPTWLIQFASLVKPEQKEELQREILGATRDRMLREICEALETLTSEHPLVLIFEDLHWCDPSTLDLISALARRRAAARLLLVCTYRPLDVALSQSPLRGLKQDLQVHRLCEEITLERLTESDIAQYLATEFSVSNLPSDLANLIYRHSAGNALFMVAIVQDMLKKGLIVRDDGVWRLATPLHELDPGVPETLQHMIEVQFDQLSAEEQRILKSASVAGERFSVWSISSMLDVATGQIEDLFEGLAERQQFIKTIGIQELANGSLSPNYEFRHALYRQVIYGRLSDLSRSRRHREMGERLKSLGTSPKRERELASELALHFEKGRDYEQAIRYLMLSAENVAGRFAYRDAIQVLQHAVKLVPRVALNVAAQLEIQVFELIGDAYYALGAMDECAKAYAAGAARAADAGLRELQVGQLISLMRPFGLIDPEQGIAAIDEAAEISRGLNDPLLVARTEMLAAGSRLLYETWRKEDADLLASANQRIRELDDSSGPAYHRMIYAYVQALQGNYREALDIFEAFIPKIDGASSLMVYLFAVAGETVALLYLGRFGEVLRIVRAEREMAEKNGNDPWLFNFREAWLRTLCLDFDGARRICEFIVRPGAEYPTGQPETIARVAAGYAELDRGNYDQAMANFRQVGDPEVTPKFFLHWAWRIRAQLGLSEAWLLSGDLENARREGDIALKDAFSTAEPNLQALAWEVKARIAIAEQDSKRARECIEQGLGIVKQFEIPVTAWRIQATAWELYLQTMDDKLAETHRASAEANILTIANSFAPDEPLRKTFLEAAPVRRILTDGQSHCYLS